MANYVAFIQKYNPATCEYDNVSISELNASIVDDGKIVISSDYDVRVMNLGESCVMLDPEPE